MANKPNLIKGITPKGIAQWPKLNKPDEYQGKKAYKTNLILSEDDSAKLLKQIEEASEAKREAVIEELNGKLAEAKNGQEKAKIKKSLETLTVGFPYEEEVDDNGDPTGGYIFKFKSNAEYKDKAGALKPLNLGLFDSKGKPTKAAIWGGSTLKIAYVLVPYWNPSSGKCGVSIRMEGVQIIELVSGGGRSAAALGFGEEDGYEADEDQADTPFSGAEDQEQSGDGSEEDDF